MFKKSKGVILAIFSSALVMGGQAAASDHLLSRIYAKVEGGASISSQTEATVTGTLREMALEKDTLGTGRSVGAGLGMVFNDYLRADVMFNYRTGFELDTPLADFPSTDPITGDISSYGVMASIYWDIATLQAGGISISPFLNAGAGLAVNKVDSVTVQEVMPIEFEGDTTTNFAWHVGAGLGIGLTENLTLDTSYRYSDLGDFKSGKNAKNFAGALEEPFKGDLSTHELMVGLRYSF
ncbi:outer membrane protein [Roseibium denhamense]|uniref:Opacity protein n=1 Tax=Roseibium denhamense TaxID=76305 RepID=A0ABY1PMG2_9HYPH|nr:outer membrane beta-barrel protein [Roseibium denhamense]SMP37000.1 Opacity protein [Roseibium denhamense]